MNTILKPISLDFSIIWTIERKRGQANNIGVIYNDKGDPDNALKCYQQAKAIFKKIGRKPQLQTVQNSIDHIHQKSTN
ncbi:MAG: tetratricopeptide repeat protein [Desulfobacterales bacterium]|nr:tetratricopeptide repeat protein [Desulfobacterales bacterium]